jgi:Uma2 family endonuclease
MQTPSLVSDDEYLVLERAATTKHELVNGHVVAMAGATPRHNAMVANVLASLVPQLRGRGCRPLASDQRVHVPATGLYAYPDVTIVCGELAFHPKDAMTITNPKVIIEVLSDGTEAFDRGAKFAHYRGIPSLQTYVLITQHEPRVERYERGSGAEWVFHETVGESSSLALDAVGATIGLADLYADLPPLT